MNKCSSVQKTVMFTQTDFWIRGPLKILDCKDVTTYITLQFSAEMNTIGSETPTTFVPRTVVILTAINII